MNAKTLAKAIAALRKSADHLRNDNLSITQQVLLASDCDNLASDIERELARITVPVEAA